MKNILGLDLGTNSIGWSLIQHDFHEKTGNINGMGVRIIPMSADDLGKFDSGQSHSQTAERTNYRGVRRMYQRDNLRRERLHRVLHILGFLPEHYSDSIDFERRLGQFKPGSEIKINYKKGSSEKHEFIFMESFMEMLEDFKKQNPSALRTKANGEQAKVPYDWTIYFLRKKALFKKISKEELAWVILNFNQKRGYYQLRGEEQETENQKEFVSLKVAKLLDTGDKVKGKTLYKVEFENGWVYDRPVVKTEDWEGRTKEFIVTTKILSNGEAKRSFKAVDSEKDWIAIKSKTERDIDLSNKTVGEFIYDELLADPGKKIRGKLIKTIERKFYKEELRTILSKQIELQPELFSRASYKACIEELYPMNEAHRANISERDFLYLFLEDIIFYQRPLKSQKGNIAGCSLEFRIRKGINPESQQLEEIRVPVKVIPKSHPLFQEFRIWQWLSNLKIYDKEEIEKGEIKDVTNELLQNPEDWDQLFEFLNNKKELTQAQFIAFFVKNGRISKTEKDHFRWNYPEDKKYPFAETRSSIITRLNKVEGIESASDFLKVRSANGSDTLEQLWHIIYSISDPNEYSKGLKTFAEKHGLNPDSFTQNFKKFPPFSSDFGSFSRKAISKLLPLMRCGKFWDASLITDETRNRADSIMERVNHLKLGPNYSSKDFDKALSFVSDDDIPKQLIKSFLPLKGINPCQGLNTYQASYLIYGRHSEGDDLSVWRNPHDIDQYLAKFKQHSLRNPIVEQVVTETLRVVRDIWIEYGKGKPGFFDEVHLELGREMKNPAGKREQIARQNIENENTNERIRAVLKEIMNDPSVKADVRSFSPSHQELLKIYEEGVFKNPEADFSLVEEDEIIKIRRNVSPSQADIQKYKLWLEQGYISPYTGKVIQLSELFTSKYQIEHIIPQSRYFDNSLGNKVICESTVNGDKSNQTAYEYLKEKGGSIVDGHHLFTLEQYENHVNRYFKKSKTKLKNLLSEDIPEAFINRQLNDSRYISKFIKGLLSNIVREDEEKEATSKNLISVPGSITSRLKQDWGLNDKWNELIRDRFERLNELTESTDFGQWDKKINAFRISVPDDIRRGFNKKRIDHRHHALDALLVACTSRNHIHYLSALNAERENHALRKLLLITNKQGHFTKHFQLPWLGFSTETKNSLEQIVISFKQNLRVINKASNKFWSYRDENGEVVLGHNGKPKKVLRKQTKGDHWSIRKSMHKETVSGIYHIDVPKNKVATSVRSPLSSLKNQKHLEKITGKRIREVILPNHIKNYQDDKGKPDFERAFSQEGIEDLNSNIQTLNNGKAHQPIYHVKLFEIGSKFKISENEKSAKGKKYVEAAKGTNLFFAVYWDENKQKRNFDTVPLNEVIEHQKQVAHLPASERTPIQPKPELGKLLFTLSPNDLVYFHDKELTSTGANQKLSQAKNNKLFKIVSFTGRRLYALPHTVAKSIVNKVEFTQLNKIELIKEKEVCWKVNVDRLGNIGSFNP